MKTLRFTVDEAQAAADGWRFNCGPAALCAVLGLAPDDVRPHLGTFEQRGYMNPSMMFGALKSLGQSWRVIPDGWPLFGLCRVQWEGPWMQPGVPIAARYRYTHWVGASQADGLMIFDVNATCAGGWLTEAEWSEQLVPWLLDETTPRASGGWHLTHRLELEAVV